MNKGIIYVMTTVVPGLVKIGITRTDNFEQRMYFLEHNGYRNVTGLKRTFAIEVEDYTEKEKLLGNIFEKSRLEGSELFAIDQEIVIQLLSAFDGREIYPRNKKKEEVFKESAREQQEKETSYGVPNGVYTLSQQVRGFGRVEARLSVKDGVYIVQKGSTVAPANFDWAHKLQAEAEIEGHELVSDERCQSYSAAATLVTGKARNGWEVWKDSDGRSIDYYRE